MVELLAKFLALLGRGSMALILLLTTLQSSQGQWEASQQVVPVGQAWNTIPACPMGQCPLPVQSGFLPYASPPSYQPTTPWNASFQLQAPGPQWSMYPATTGPEVSEYRAEGPSTFPLTAECMPQVFRVYSPVSSGQGLPSVRVLFRCRFQPTRTNGMFSLRER